jgi:hypothetical protein
VLPRTGTPWDLFRSRRGIDYRSGAVEGQRTALLMMLEEESRGKLGLLLNESIVVVLLIKISLLLAFAFGSGEGGERRRVG